MTVYLLFFCLLPPLRIHVLDMTLTPSRKPCEQQYICSE